MAATRWLCAQLPDRSLRTDAIHMSAAQCEPDVVECRCCLYVRCVRACLCQHIAAVCARIQFMSCEAAIPAGRWSMLGNIASARLAAMPCQSHRCGHLRRSLLPAVVYNAAPNEKFRWLYYGYVIHIVCCLVLLSVGVRSCL